MQYDFDLFVSGAGSGGVRASRMSASFGARVGIAEDMFLGGTCVNVGCIPKKLMHTAAILGEAMRDDAAAFGWASPDVKHNWAAMRERVQNHIKSLNFQYRVALREAGIS